MRRYFLPVAALACGLGAGCDSADDGSAVADSQFFLPGDTTEANGTFIDQAGNSVGGPGQNGNETTAPGAGGATAAITDGSGNVIAEPMLNLEAEEEVQVKFELPSAGDRYVYAANPESNTVSVIDSETLAIQTVEAGDRPTFLQSLGGKDAAIVLNVNSDDATIVRTNGGVSKSTSVPVVAGSNAIAVSPDGEFAVVYFNVDQRSAGPSGSFQDLSILVLEDGQSIPMTVGFRPSAISFSEDSARAFVVTEDGVSILDFEQIVERGSHIARTVPLGAANEELSIDVTVTPDGRYALARRPNDAILRLVNLVDTDAELKTLDLRSIFADTDRLARESLMPVVVAQDAGKPEAGDAGTVVDSGAVAAVGTEADAALPLGDGSAPLTDAATESELELALKVRTPETTDPDVMFTDVTDLDLSPQGDFALAVIRDRNTVFNIPIPQGFEDPSLVSIVTVGAQLVGSVSIAPQGDRALLYTTAADEVERISILDIASSELSVFDLPKSVLGVTISPDGESALIVHRKLLGNPNEIGLDPNVLIDRSYGYSALKLDDGFSKLQLTAAPPGAFSIVPQGNYVFILFNEPALNLREVHRVGLDSFLVQPLELGSPPVSVGVVPGTNKVFVGQEHPDGRITFIDWLTAETESVTGFELNSRIRE